MPQIDLFSPFIQEMVSGANLSAENSRANCLIFLIANFGPSLCHRDQQRFIDSSPMTGSVTSPRVRIKKRDAFQILKGISLASSHFENSPQ